jgi:hypothetical protein
MRTCLLIIVLFAMACQQPPREVEGIYLGTDSQGVFFPCDKGGSLVQVHDAALQARYRALTDTASAGVFVRLRAEERDSGSVYESRHYLILDSILEVRVRREGECSGVAEPSEVLRGLKAES